MLASRAILCYIYLGKPYLHDTSDKRQNELGCYIAAERGTEVPFIRLGFAIRTHRRELPLYQPSDASQAYDEQLAPSLVDFLSLETWDVIMPNLVEQALIVGG